MISGWTVKFSVCVNCVKLLKKKTKLFHGESIHLDSPSIIMYVRCAPCPKPVIGPV